MAEKYKGPGKSRFDGKGQRRFIGNMAVAGALGASSGHAAGVLHARAKGLHSPYRPVKAAGAGALLGTAGGVALVVHTRRKKVSKSMAQCADCKKYNKKSCSHVSKGVQTGLNLIQQASKDARAGMGPAKAGFKHIGAAKPASKLTPVTYKPKRSNGVFGKSSAFGVDHG